MGEAELYKQEKILAVRSVIILYGEAASDRLAYQVAQDISFHWNEPAASILIKKEPFSLKFDIEAKYEPDLSPETVWYNDDPRMNYFRVEEYVMGNISFVDGLPCNTGYLKLDNLAQTSTTIAHEYGHTLGLEHPSLLDIRGKGLPGIMYPRGSLVDSQFQYWPHVAAGEYGGTMDPVHRKVTLHDISALQLHRLSFNEHRKSIVGGFSSIYHERHLPTT
jgi:hypothetical protein